jgi:hypothetical protein
LADSYLEGLGSLKSHTDAYDKLRGQAEDLFNFVVVVCYAMPLLKTKVKEVKASGGKTVLHVPDYFVHDKSDIKRIEKEGIAKYKANLASHLVLSSFSFFEDYVNTAIQEIIDFHGGQEKFLELARKQRETSMIHLTAEIKLHKGKLQEPLKKAKNAQYNKHAEALGKLGYMFPTELLAAYGVQVLIKKVGSMKAHEMPEFLRDCFGLKLDRIDIEQFDRIRDYRNKIAHGTKVKLCIREAIEMNSFLRDLALKIDQHLIEHFYVFERMPL